MGKISSKYAAIAFVVFESVLMNEFLNHHVAQNTVYIQVEKDASTFVFHFLQEQGYHGLMYKPTRKEFDLYWVRDGLVRTDFVTEAPLTLGKPHEICIEKLLVELFCGRRIGWTYSNGDYGDVVKQAAETFCIDAKTRWCQNWKSIFMIIWSRTGRRSIPHPGERARSIATASCGFLFASTPDRRYNTGKREVFLAGMLSGRRHGYGNERFRRR